MPRHGWRSFERFLPRRPVLEVGAELRDGHAQGRVGVEDMGGLGVDLAVGEEEGRDGLGFWVVLSVDEVGGAEMADGEGEVVDCVAELGWQGEEVGSIAPESAVGSGGRHGGLLGPCKRFSLSLILGALVHAA